MIIRKEWVAEAKELEVVIRYCEETPELHQLLHVLDLKPKMFVACKGRESTVLDLTSIFYIESVDGKVFLYGKRNVFEADTTLTDFLRRYGAYGFCRISKSQIVNLRQIASLKSLWNSRILITLNNQEQCIVSRTYAKELKQRLGMEGCI